MGGPCPGGWHSCGWVCAEGTELRASGDKKLSGGKEAGRRKGEQSDHLLKSDRVGWEAPGRLPKPPGVRGGAAKGPNKETLQSRGWRPGMDRAVPPPSPRSPRAPQPEPPPSTIRSPSLRWPRASGYCSFSGSEGWRLRSASRVRALSRGRSRAGEAAGARGWSRGLSEGAVPLLRGGCAATPRAASRPRPPPAASVLLCSVSEFAGVSAPGSRRAKAARQEVGSLRGSGSLPPRRGASRVPLGPEEGGVRGLGGQSR